MKLALVTLIYLSSLIFFPQAQAEDYRVTTVGEAAQSAVTEFANEAATRNSNINLKFLPGLASPSELIEFLSQGLIDIAVVPFERVPELAGSPLLEPFLSEDAVGVRQSIDSEVGAFAKAKLVECPQHLIPTCIVHFVGRWPSLGISLGIFCRRHTTREEYQSTCA